MVEISENQDVKLSQFLETNKRYIKSQTEIKTEVGNFLKVTLKDDAWSDEAKYNEIKNAALKISGTPKGSSFLFPREEKKTLEKALGIPQDYKLLILHEEDIEEGGPQPRLKILDDPTTRALAECIETEGQRDPVDTYPSPLNNGKHRICEGHRRYTAIFGILKPQGKLDFIIAKEKNRSELVAWQDAWILNDKDKLTDYEKGAYIVELQKRFPETYPNQRAIASKLGLSLGTVNMVLTAYNEVKNAETTSPDHVQPLSKMSGRTIRTIRTAPAELKNEIVQEVISHDATTTETEKLVEAVKSEEAPTSQTVEEKAAQIFAERDKETKKASRFIDRLVNDLSPYYPKDLVEAVYCSFSDLKSEDEATRKKVIERCQDTIGVLVQHAKDEGKLESAITEASTW